MAGYHIDYQGNPGRCTAKKRCPYGDLKEDHYPTVETARRAYELENHTARLRFAPRTAELLDEIGPRQLPNRAWISLRNALESDRFSAHEIELASVTLKEEQEKLERITQETPRAQWGKEEKEAEEQLQLLNEAQEEVSETLNSWRASLRSRLEQEFPRDF